MQEGLMKSFLTESEFGKKLKKERFIKLILFKQKNHKHQKDITTISKTSFYENQILADLQLTQQCDLIQFECDLDQIFTETDFSRQKQNEYEYEKYQAQICRKMFNDVGSNKISKKEIKILAGKRLDVVFAYDRFGNFIGKHSNAHKNQIFDKKWLTEIFYDKKQLKKGSQNSLKLVKQLITKQQLQNYKIEYYDSETLSLNDKFIKTNQNKQKLSQNSFKQLIWRHNLKVKRKLKSLRQKQTHKQHETIQQNQQHNLQTKSTKQKTQFTMVSQNLNLIKQAQSLELMTQPSQSDIHQKISNQSNSQYWLILIILVFILWIFIKFRSPFVKKKIITISQNELKIQQDTSLLVEN